MYYAPKNLGLKLTMTVMAVMMLISALTGNQKPQRAQVSEPPTRIAFTITPE